MGKPKSLASHIDIPRGAANFKVFADMVKNVPTEFFEMATPDGKTLFVNIQHPGETASERSDPAHPTAVSAWPANQFANAIGGRPRSGTLVITRQDGKPISS